MKLRSTNNGAIFGPPCTMTSVGQIAGATKVFSLVALHSYNLLFMPIFFDNICLWLLLHCVIYNCMFFIWYNWCIQDNPGPWPTYCQYPLRNQHFYVSW